MLQTPDSMFSRMNCNFRLPYDFPQRGEYFPRQGCETKTSRRQGLLFKSGMYVFPQRGEYFPQSPSCTQMKPQHIELIRTAAQSNRPTLGV